MIVRPLACLVVLAGAGCVGSSPCASPKRPLAFLPTPEEAGPQELWETDPTQQTLSSRWYLEVAGEPLTVALTSDLTGAHLAGTAISADGGVDVVDHASWDATTGVLDFRRVGAGYWQWVHARAVEGVLTGRVSYSTTTAAPPPAVADYANHVVGWNDYYFSHDTVPRVFDLSVDGRSARLRLDRDAGGAFVGRLKVYSDDASGVDAEEIEYDVAVEAWDGHQLTFVRSSPSFTQRFEATVDGNTVLGTMQSSATDAPVSFDGTRAELVGYGLSPRDAVARADWQLHTRRQLAHLMMADNPAPLSLSVDRHPFAPPTDSGDIAPDRDDDADDHAADYALDELVVQATLPNPYGGAPLTRAMHGFVTTPSGDAPAGGWPALIVLNGHDGSALGTFDPDEPMYWYGDAWARRGYVVLALDIGHRPLDDRAGLYRNYVQGDSPDDGNGPHPAIETAGLDSDWAEDGERAWDVERAVDYLLTLANVDGARIAVTGLSLGGEIASVAGALDSRLAAVIPAGFVPDLTVMAGHGNHPCWRWLAGDPLEWFSASDLHALIAPRPLIVETGAVDVEFSNFWPPFVDGKEVARRSRAAYADAPSQLALYLHDGGHEYRFGDINVSDGSPPSYITVPASNGPSAADDLSWASDGSTVSLGETLADALAGFLPAPAR